MIWFMSDVFEPTVYGLQMSGLNSLPSRPWSAVIKVRLRGTALRSAGAPTGLAASAGFAASVGFAASAGLAGSAGLAAGAAGAQAAMAALPASAAAVIRKRRRDADRAGVSIGRAPLFFESRGRCG